MASVPSSRGEGSAERRGLPRILCLAGGAAAVLSLSLAPVVASAHTNKTFYVHPGGSIQAAVDQAQAGDTVKVLAGVYQQQVNITTSGITLKGEGPADTIIEPPASTGGNCDAAMGPTGICVGAPPIAEGGPINAWVKNVTVKQLTVRNFSGDGIFLFGTQNATVYNVHAIDDGTYGIFFNSSTQGTADHNYATGASEAGIYYGDSPNAKAEITDNTSVNNNGWGILVRDSKNGTVEDNKSEGNCIGILVLNTGYGQGLANTVNWTVRDNNVRNNNNACAANAEHPPFSGMGIALVGASKVKVEDNDVRGNAAGSNPTVASGGIVMVSSVQLTGGTDESNNTIRDNELDDNTPDILWDGKGAGNRFDDNECETSVPGWICS